jgi:hypothetical protein
LPWTPRAKDRGEVVAAVHLGEKSKFEGSDDARRVFTNRLLAGLADLERAHTAFAFDERESRNHVRAAALAASNASALSEQRFVRFDGLAFAAKLGRVLGYENSTDTVRHEPRGFVGHAQHTVKLVGGNALLG